MPQGIRGSEIRS